MSNADLRDSKDNPLYVHEDQHAIYIGKDNRVYSANDGGFARTDDFGATWKTMNQNLAVSMFYSLDVDRWDSENLGGGTQDIGVWFRGPLSQADRESKAKIEFRQAIKGDGGWVCHDPNHPGVVYASTKRMASFFGNIRVKNFPRDVSTIGPIKASAVLR